jgi:hypothetical protein
MSPTIDRLKDYFLRLSLNQKLVAMMLLLSVSLMSVFIVLYGKTEKAMYQELRARHRTHQGDPGRRRGGHHPGDRRKAHSGI